MSANPRSARLTLVFWSVALATVLGVGFGDRVVSHLAYAAERGRLQASEDELAQLEQQLPELNAVSRAFKLVAKVARAGVVHIKVEGGQLAQGNREQQERLRELFGDSVPQEQLEYWSRVVPPGSGSGVIIDRDGFVLTNNHVVEGRNDITVVLSDQREVKAAIVGTDPKTDLAVLKVEAPDLHPLKFGDSDQLEVGDWVIAVGSPFGLQQTVTHGIVSATGRSQIVGVDIDYQNFIQTDAAINPGNSGGPLLNLRGEVVGINTAIATHGDGVNAGVAFTIPANLAVKIANQLKTHGEVRRGYLGIVPIGLNPADAEVFGLPSGEGVLVEMVVRRSPADRSGMQVEDVIVAIDDAPIKGLEQFRALVADLPPNERVRLRVVRDGEELTVAVRLGLQPERLRATNADEVEDSRRVNRLGLRARTLRPGELRAYGEATRGVWVAGWDPEWEEPPAIRRFEVITECNGTPIGSVRDLERALEEIPRHRKIELTVTEPTGDKRIITVKPRGQRQ